MEIKIEVERQSYYSDVVMLPNVSIDGIKYTTRRLTYKSSRSSPRLSFIDKFFNLKQDQYVTVLELFILHNLHHFGSSRIKTMNDLDTLDEIFDYMMPILVAKALQSLEEI